MSFYYDDNFGEWNMDSEEDLDFYRHVRKQSVSKVCVGCGRKVSILPQYDVCDPCATKREQGWDF